MRAVLTLLPGLVFTVSAFGQSIGPAANPAADVARNAARWAELEAQGRMTEGDYEGALRAQEQADIERRSAERLEATQRAAAGQKNTASPR